MTGLQQARRDDRADYDWLAFSRAVKAKCWNDPRGIRGIGEAIGVTATDVSRAMGGQMVSAGKIFAICDWLGIDPREFYLAPSSTSTKSTCCTCVNVKHLTHREVVS